MAWAPDYITDDQLKEYEQIPDELDDDQVAWAITTASGAVNGTCRRQFGLLDVAEQRRYTPRWSGRRGRWWVWVDDFQTVTGLLVHVDLDGDEVFTDLVDGVVRKLPLNAAGMARPWERLVLPAGVQLCGAEGEVAVTARWGWTTVPTAVEQATALQASRLLARRSSPYGIAGSPEAGSEMRLLARVDPDVRVSLAAHPSYIREEHVIA